jgi:outer membrane protein assembly factor BamB
VSAFLSATVESSAESQWQGPIGPSYNGHVSATGLLKKFPASGPKQLWSYPAGDGYAAPAIQGDRLIYTHQFDNQTVIDCLDSATGKRLWRFSRPISYRDQYSRQYGPRSSPVIANDAVYVHAVNGSLYCLSLADGNLRWERDLSADFDVPDSFFGVGATPFVKHDSLYLNVGGNKASVVALSAKDGKNRWQADVGWGAGYAAVVPMQADGSDAVLAFCGGKTRPPTGGIVAVTNKTGKILFRHPWRSTNFASVNAASPIVAGNDVFITAGYRTGGCRLRFSEGKFQQLWTTDELGSQWTTPILQDGHLYGIDGSNSQLAEIVCLEWQTGKLKWRQQPEWREETPSGSRTMRIMRGSLLAADNDFLCLGEAGHLLWLRLTPMRCTILSRTRLFSADQTFTPPAIANGRLYVCQNAPDEFDESPPQLRCYDLRAR